MESRMHLFSPMNLKSLESPMVNEYLYASGRIQSASVEEMREQMRGDAERIGLDLEVTLVRE